MARDTQRTLAAKDLQRERLERAIEILLARYPYLIAPELSRPKRQVWISDKDRVDLFFVTEKDVMIAEIKCQPCSMISVRQLMRYIHIESAKQPSRKVSGVLIGPRLTPRGSETLESSSLDIRFLQLEVDIPSSVFICRDCRRAYGSRLDSCPRCQCRQVI